MDVKEHYLMTFIALFLLGVMVGSTQENNLKVCESQGRMDCAPEDYEYRMNHVLGDFDLG